MLQLPLQPTGTAYGVALNDRLQIAGLGAALWAAPYKAPPLAPVMYIKSRSCWSFSGSATPIPPELTEVQVSGTIAVLFGAQVRWGAPDCVRSAIIGACLAIDISEPFSAFHRPPIRQICRDGFLPLGGFSALPPLDAVIVTDIDGQEAHRWSLDRLIRPLDTLVADLSRFMTFEEGDLLLLGLPGDAPKVRIGQAVTVRTAGLPALATTFVAEALP